MPGATVLAKVNVLYTIVPLSAMWKVVEDSGADGVAAHFLMTLLHNTMIETARQMGKKVFIYTVDSMYVSKWLECLGVDAIVSNNPEKIVSGAECPITGAYGR
jgi:glycerophosphoryl diester phosphodiesterase